MIHDYRKHMEDFNLLDQATFTAQPNDFGNLCDRLLTDGWQIVGVDKGLYQEKDGPDHYRAVTKLSVTAKRSSRLD